ncbi:nuclear transport factor 2 family protein [Novosphingobium mangrovi (ex Huang et al. 2023)]|uniref:Nuclear transport factor 2 family protein n=1 Tax=Novosphingobium mangrovi (ex Huang et al. 2023) TaxID=2976432 RepID=A0ABT2I2V7_9SPHN|nr:nuclear transport factor 2 family protein [Novosphingobium mangrovi (ex Huang et al. 2023)]MCT2399137.1 nuclear transport factor 2 family protein [Novosphingobium mangrovi (ex Huang et al. 2023)]
MTDSSFEQIAEKFAITEQIYRYCRSVDRLDVPLGHSVFHEDATADYGPTGYRGTGRGAIDWICEAHKYLLAHSHQVTNINIVLDGERAGSEAYVTATLRMEREGKMMLMEIWARYCDRWSKRDGTWRIDHRDTVIDYDSIREVTPMNRHEWARRDPQDPSYAALGAGR